MNNNCEHATEETCIRCYKTFLEWELKRNQINKALFQEVLAKCLELSAGDTFIGHHLSFNNCDGSQQEIPAADTLLFDHVIMRKLFGDDSFMNVMMTLAVEPPETRDELFAKLFAHRYSRAQKA